MVLVIIGMASTSVTLALRDTDADRLDREAQRLNTLLETARAQSRASGVAVTWQPTADGYPFLAPSGTLPTESTLGRDKTWLTPGMTAQVVEPRGAQHLVLGPEPLLPAQRVSLQLGGQQIIVGTDGLAPFAVLTE